MVRGVVDGSYHGIIFAHLGGFFLDVDAAAEQLRGLEEAAKQVERPSELGELEITITPPGPVDLDTVKRFEDLGVSRLAVMRGFAEATRDEGTSAVDHAIAFIEQTAETLKLA